MGRTLKLLLAMAFAGAGLFGLAGVSAAQQADDCYPIPDDGCPDDGDDDGDIGEDDGEVDDGDIGEDDDGGDDDGIGGADDGVDVGGVTEQRPGGIDVQPAGRTQVLANVLAYTGLSTAGLIGFAAAVLAAGTVLLLSARRRRTGTG